MKGTLIALGAVVLVAVLAGVYSLSLPNPASTAVRENPGDSVIRGFGLLPEFNLDTMIEKSDVVALVTVESVLGCDWNQEYTTSPVIHTNVALKVDRYLGPELPYEKLCLRLPGGRIGNAVAIMENTPVFTEGEQALVFLYQPPYEMSPVPAGFAREAYFLLGAYGKFEVRGDKAVSDVAGKQYELPKLMVKIQAARSGK